MRKTPAVPELLLGASRPARLWQGRWRPLGMNLRWRAADRSLAKAAEGVLGTVAPGASAGIDADLLLLRSPAGAQLGAVGIQRAADGQAYREAEGLCCVLTAGGSLSVADFGRGQVVAWAAADSPLAEEAEALVAAPIWRLAAARGLVACHAAALRTPDGRALLLRGAGGAGKSTLALAAWRQGWPLIAEEVAWLDGRGAADARVGPAGWLVRGRPDRLHLDQATTAAPWFMTIRPPWYRPPAASPNGGAARQPGATASSGRPPTKIALDLRPRPRGLCGAAPLGPLVFLCREDAALRGRWVHCGPAEALARWEDGCIPGEASQAWALRRMAASAITARGAYLLGDAAPPVLVDSLRAIALDREGRP